MEPMSELEQVELLTGPGAGGLLEAALGTEDATITHWDVHALHHRPSAGVSVGYTLQVRDPSGRESSQYVCATPARLTDPSVPGLVRLEHPGGRTTVHLWRHPHDPELPALPPACDAAAMSGVLGRPVVVHMVAYRPTRRCVLKLTDGEATRAFVKVVRRGRGSDVVAAARRGERFAATFQVPRMLLLSASSGYISSIGRCLRAAAWKTTSG